MPSPHPSEASRAWREALTVVLGALLLGLAVVGRPAWDPGLVYCATDTATCQAPWSNLEAPRNPELSDSGVAFYPHYRLLSERWRAGQVPLWNPDLFVGVPLLANPQWGALDPQVGALVLLEALGGAQLFDLGLAWSALLRIAAAAAGTYALARRLRLGPPGAALAGAAYGLSGSVILWLGFSLSHVTPLLPWVLLGLEGLRVEKSRARAFATTALGLAAAIYGGHPEVAFFVGLTAGLWALVRLREDPPARVLALGALATGVLLAAPLLVPFVEYLRHSGALLAHRLAPVERHMPDLTSLGALLLFAGFTTYWRRSSTTLATGARPSGAALQALALALAWSGLLLFLSRRGMHLDLGLAAPTSIEGGSARLPLPALALALGAWSAGAGRTPLASFLALGAALLLLLVLEAPGVIDLWRWLPLVGLAAPARAACCAALFTALLAGLALEHSSRRGRWAAVLAVLALLLVQGMRAAPAGLDPRRAGLDLGDEVIEYVERPGDGTFEGAGRLAGRLHGGLEVDELRLGLERLDGQGQVLERADFVRIAELRDTDQGRVRAFDFGEFDLRPLGPGDWRLKLELQRAGALVGTRFPALVRVPAARAWDATGLSLAAVTLLILCAPQTAWGAWVLVLLTAFQGVLQGRAWNPAVPRDEHFRITRTEAFLAERLGAERFFAAPGILPGDTALLAGLSTIDGYDALDVASFDGYRAFALKPERNPLLDWNAQGAELTSPGFALLGVRALLFHEARELEGWTLVAGPEGAPEPAEVWIYAADAPLPRAFCVPRVLRRRDVLADLANFDPRREAFLEEPFGFRLEAPFERAEVRLRERAAESLVYEVELDGEGLFVATEQHFPGWRLRVDGRPREILRANSIFRGVFLEAGTHELRFEYAPASWLWGRLAGLLGLACLGLGLWRARASGLTPGRRRNP